MTGPEDEGGRTAEQVARDLAADNTPMTAGTASGLAAMGSPGGQETARTDESNEGIKPDGVAPGQGPIGQQAEAAFFTPQGSVLGNSIPSPTGPVPASTIADPGARDAAVKKAREGARSSRLAGRTGRFRISDAAAARLTPAELRAVAYDRGYTDVEGGRRAVLARFLKAQAEDEGLDDPPEGHPLGVVPGQTEPVGPVPGAPGAATGNPLVTPSRPGGLKTPLGDLRNTDGTAVPAPAGTARPAATAPSTGAARPAPTGATPAPAPAGTPKP